MSKSQRSDIYEESDGEYSANMRAFARNAAKDAAQTHMEELEGKLSERLGAQVDRLDKVESLIDGFKDLQLLSAGGEKLIDVITNHVMETGFSIKFRALR